MAGGGHGLPRDAVDLVEGMWPQQTVVRSPDEQLQRERLALQVAVELAREQNPAQHPRTGRSDAIKLSSAEANSKETVTGARG